jgi:hypothetical protein
VSATDQLIMGMSERELRAVLLGLAGGIAGRAVQDATVAEISAILTQTRGLSSPGGAR